jgi:hypothetical protein
LDFRILFGIFKSHCRIELSQEEDVPMPTVDFTLDDIKQVIDERLDQRFIAEREITRRLVREEINVQFEHFVNTEFLSFIRDNFEPAMEQIDQRFGAIDQRFDAMDQRFDAMDQRFDQIEDRVDHLASDTAALRIDLRQVKHHLHTRPAQA